MSLIIENLKVSYGNVQAVKGVSLNVAQGEMVTLIGANGAGKTTLLRSISGLIPISGGRVAYDDKNITGLSPEEIVKRGIVHVPEGRMIFPNLTVGENLDIGAYLYPKDARTKQERDFVFALFPRLVEREKQSAGTLSGGEQQMLAIGRALMSRPKLLLLDEPSLGLAPNLVQQIFKSFAEIQKRGVDILLVEQDAVLALKKANRGYVLETGEIVLEGPAAELIANEDIKKAYLGL